MGTIRKRNKLKEDQNNSRKEQSETNKNNKWEQKRKEPLKQKKLDKRKTCWAFIKLQGLQRQKQNSWLAEVGQMSRGLV